MPTALYAMARHPYPLGCGGAGVDLRKHRRRHVCMCLVLHLLNKVALLIVI